MSPEHSETRDMQLEIIDRTETKTQNINECNIRFKITKYTLKHQKPCVRANELQYKIKEKLFEY